MARPLRRDVLAWVASFPTSLTLLVCLGLPQVRDCHGHVKTAADNGTSPFLVIMALVAIPPLAWRSPVLRRLVAVATLIVAAIAVFSSLLVIPIGIYCIAIRPCPPKRCWRDGLGHAGMEITVETAEGIRAYISHPLIPVAFSGLWYIASGSYSIRREARIDGRRYALIPWARRQPDADVIREVKKGRGGCRADVQHFAAIDVQTNTLHDKTWIYTGDDCDVGNRWDQKLWLAPGFAFNGFQVRQQTASEAFVRRVASEREKAAIEQRAKEAEQRWRSR